MGNIGLPELVVIFIVALVVFGPKKLPELSRSLGKGLNEFKRASNELRNTLDAEIRAEERKTNVIAPPALAPIPPSDPAQVVEPIAAPDVSDASETVARGHHGS
jgi:TatA/E family protein of Tat protein translocase